MITITQFLTTVLDVLLPPHPIEEVSLDNFLEKADSARLTTPYVHADWILAAYKYRTPLVRDVVRALKYKESAHAAHLLAHGIYPVLLDYLSDTLLFDNTGPILLVPIPLSKKRLRERGYDQALLLAKEVMKLSEKNTLHLASDVLTRIKHTLPQTETKSRKERMQNIRGCFAVQNPINIAEKNIILLDDVTTTGATFTEARLVLLNAGAKSVIAVAAAH